MNLSVQQIAELFSGGQFSKVYMHLSQNIVWNVVGEDSFVGKEAVVKNCEQVASYFNTVTTKFKTENIIVEGNKVAIEGTAEFIREGKRVAYVWASDIYQFNNNGELEKITSYCIQEKK